MSPIVDVAFDEVKKKKKETEKNFFGEIEKSVSLKG